MPRQSGVPKMQLEGFEDRKPVVIIEVPEVGFDEALAHITKAFKAAQIPTDKKGFGGVSVAGALKVYGGA